MGMGMGGYSLQHALGNLHVLHGDKHAQLVQRVHVADLIQELHATAQTSGTQKKNVINYSNYFLRGGNWFFFFFFSNPVTCYSPNIFFFFPPFFFLLQDPQNSHFQNWITITEKHAYPFSLENVADLMKGLEMARMVRMNHVGWTMMRHFRFFLNLQWQLKKKCKKKQKNDVISPFDYHLIQKLLLPVNHLVASLQPANAGHLPPWRGSVQVDDHVVVSH